MMACPEVCIEGCNCAADYVRNSTGFCILQTDCDGAISDPVAGASSPSQSDYEESACSANETFSSCSAGIDCQPSCTPNNVRYDREKLKRPWKIKFRWRVPQYAWKVAIALRATSEMQLASAFSPRTVLSPPARETRFTSMKAAMEKPLKLRSIHHNLNLVEITRSTRTARAAREVAKTRMLR